MSTGTSIAWTDATFNPWWGCTRVSPGCEHCYAETFAHRLGLDVWGVGTGRRFFGDKHWNEPGRWNAKAEKDGRRLRVFCASMADVFEDRRDLDEQRAWLWGLIEETPHLDWQLLTKRPENIRRMVPKAWLRNPLAHVWYGTTTEDQRRLEERGAILLDVPAAVHFFSAEPLLENITLGGLRPAWLIVGGESGPGARRCHVSWIRSLLQQCKAANVPAFCKQLGANVIDRNDMFGGWEPDMWPEDLHPDAVEDSINGFREEHQGADVRIHLRDRKGGDMEEWPEDLRVREMPR